jgi:hypothetical protein
MILIINIFDLYKKKIYLTIENYLLLSLLRPVIFIYLNFNLIIQIEDLDLMERKQPYQIHYQ